ncbi:MAG: hypothetical protein WDZ63_11910 [Burkholderiales bacterium]
MKVDGPNRKTRENVRRDKAEPDQDAGQAGSDANDEQNQTESAAETRLRSLIKEMDERDASDEADDDAGFADEDISAGFRRRWSDDFSDPE